MDDQVLLHGLALSAGARPPSGDGPLVKPKRRHNRLQGTPMGKQGHDNHHGLCRSAQPIEDGTFTDAEGFVALVAEEAQLLLRMDANIALDRYASDSPLPIE